MRSSRINKKSNKSIDNTRKLTVEAESAVHQAEQALTFAQKEQISHRHKKIGHVHHE